MCVYVFFFFFYFTVYYLYLFLIYFFLKILISKEENRKETSYCFIIIAAVTIQPHRTDIPFILYSHFLLFCFFFWPSFFNLFFFSILTKFLISQSHCKITFSNHLLFYLMIYFVLFFSIERVSPYFSLSYYLMFSLNLIMFLF